MARPERGYRLSTGERVPGCTSILSRAKDSGGLIHWAWGLGMEGKDYRKVRDDAAGSGTLAHEMVEACIRGTEWAPKGPVDPEQERQARGALESFKRWEKTTGVEYLLIEEPLVSERYRFGGTPDAIARAGGELVVFDLKSGQRVYAEVIAQCAAYSVLYAERFGEMPTGAHVLRVGKEHASFGHHYWPRDVMDIGWRFFEHALGVYDLDKQLKKASGL